MDSCREFRGPKWGLSYSSVHVVPDPRRCNIVGPGIVLVSFVCSCASRRRVRIGSIRGSAHLEAEGTDEDSTQHGVVAAEKDTLGSQLAFQLAATSSWIGGDLLVDGGLAGLWLRD